jgi:hypothetical protein
MPTSSDSPSPGGPGAPPPRSDSLAGQPPDDAGRPSPVLRLQDVAAGYGAAAIVSGVSISVGPGEVVSVIGPNGAGKSTLLKAVTGRLPVMTGTVTFGSRNITNMRGHRLARMGLGFVPQTKDVFDTLTVTENLEMGGYLLTKPQLTARIEAVLSMFPALADMRARTVPGGAAGPGAASRRLGHRRAASRAEGIRGARGVRLGLHSRRGADRDRRPGQRDCRPSRHPRGLSRPIRPGQPARVSCTRSQLLATPIMRTGKP